ncbi:imidazoleglycerol-phosphate dehydratase [Helicobacter valdiviensis]|uniref:Imidazoleglycerol-phosphate dehydratase n=1 Tax=Helicobacter valdiviensis TaxID=1458358 RepID=A0A2W6MWQ1_9HELI|nr:imidazoleglycerol-phosphate dehydratase HisB [Helicobacter valdiviensis]PZT48934.1 imidazoleglycerol-phosphate dehydratase [Helicobacter valdiviensis]
MATLTRQTKETSIKATLEVYGKGISKIQTGIGFFDHMLGSLAKHALWNLELECKGDLHIDPHHSVEDCGIVLGCLLKENLYPISCVERFGNASIVMDEACVECDLDLSNRPFLVYEIPALEGKLGNFDCELAEEFFRALIFNAGISAHIIFKRGKNRHHIIEASFKAFAVAMRRACVINNAFNIPSTKGVL